jgi:two-component system, NarL family, response regulator NreC
MQPTTSSPTGAPRRRAADRPPTAGAAASHGPGSGEGERLRVLLADDHAILREGLAMMVGSQPDLEVVAQARGGREALQLANELQPDVVVLDVSMPDLAGPEVAEQLRQQCPDTRVLALTRHADPGYLRRMLRAGAHGYVVKRAATDTLLGAIRTVAEGGSYVDPTVAGAYITRSVQRADPTSDPRVRLPLSEREEQVLRLIAWGKSNKEVAAQLGISVKTAEFYKASALDKLQLRTRTDILRYALAEGWLGEEDDPE